MRAGPLRHILVIRDKTSVSRDARGSVTKTPSTHATVWGSIEPIRGDERINANQEFAQATHKIRIRHCDGLTVHMDITHDGRTFEILSAIDKWERGREMELVCKEVV